MDTKPGLLHDKVIIVSGAGGGIGAAIAKLAASCGAKVVVNDIGASSGGDGTDSRPAQAVVDAITAAGGHAVPSFHSVAGWDSAAAIVQDAVEAFGRVDAVVNNAGVVRDAIFHKMERADWDTVLGVNLSGCFYLARAAAPHFRAQKSGCYLHMVSTSGLIGNFGQVNYGAAKLGLAGLSKCIALDMERFGVRSNCIAPFAYTRMVGTIPSDTEANVKRLESIKRMTPDKIGPLAVALLADAAQDVSGQIFGVRNNELMLFNQPRPIRSVHTAEGWTPQACLDIALPALRASFARLDRSLDVFPYDPI
jgi:NAD(P)-dependent dehydrogenase (short-subunit alcohol dehydrogenase family)